MISQAEQVMDYCSSFWGGGWTLAALLLPLLLAVVGTSGSASTMVVAAATTATGPATAAVNTETVMPVTTTTNQFLVYRLHQIDLPHGAFGSRSSVFSLEPVTPGHIGDSYLRKCALFRLADLVQGHNSQSAVTGGVDVYDVFLTKVLSQALVSAALIIFESPPLNQPGATSSFTADQLTVLQTIERKLLSNETALPVYLVEAGPEINRLYEEYASKQPSGGSRASGGEPVNIKTQPSLYDAILKNTFSDSHQLVVTGPQTSAINNAVVTSIQAKLIGAGPEDQLPTYAIVAHYDSYSVVPGLALGADSNASGLVLLLELMRLFSKLYSSTKTKPRANLLFFVAGGGKLNYFGTKRWLEEHLDAGTHAPTTTLLENLQWAACLDALANSNDGGGRPSSRSLAMVVSKPPRPGTASAVFWEHLSEVAERFYPTSSTSSAEAEEQPAVTNATTLVHKKINLADASLSWEHERFSLRRLAAFTLSSSLGAATSSSSSASKSLLKRQSLADVPRPEHLEALERNANIIGEALARQLYGRLGGGSASGLQYLEPLLKAEYAVSRAHLRSLYEYYANIPRAQQTLLSTSKSSSGGGSTSSSNSYNVPPLLKAIYGAMKKYSNGHIKLLHSKVDPKAAEFVFYEPITAKMDVFNMKPAAFDIVITMGILLYLGAFYLVIRNFNYFSFGVRSHQENGHSSKVKTR